EYEAAPGRRRQRAEVLDQALRLARRALACGARREVLADERAVRAPDLAERQGLELAADFTAVGRRAAQHGASPSSARGSRLSCLRASSAPSRALSLWMP